MLVVLDLRLPLLHLLVLFIFQPLQRWRPGEWVGPIEGLQEHGVAFVRLLLLIELVLNLIQQILWFLIFLLAIVGFLSVVERSLFANVFHNFINFISN